MNTQPIPDYFSTHELTHKYAGNGFFYLSPAPNDGDFHYVLVVNADLTKTAVARVELLQKFERTVHARDETFVRDYPINETLLVKLTLLRKALESGRKVIDRGFIKEA